MAPLVLVLLILLALPASGQAPPEIGGCAIFPAGDIWNTPVDGLPVDANSAAYVATIGSDKPVHPDFGSGLWDGGPIGIPFVVVGGGEPRHPTRFLYRDESDPGPYAVPLDAPIEGGPQSDGDRHAIALDRDNCILYELFRAFPQSDGSWKTDSGAIYDLRSHALRPDGWTSADAAGLPILPGLVRYDEVAAGEIRHAIRFTAPQTRRAYVWPARHYASSLTESRFPPLGQRFRLRAGYDISGFSAQARVIALALKKYGMILADNGSSWFLSGAPDERWENEALRDLRGLHGADFEAVDSRSLMVNPDSGITGTSAASPAVAGAADFRIGVVSPAQIVSLFGAGIGPPNPLGAVADPDGFIATRLGDTEVRFDGTPAPLLYVSANQINAVVPLDTAGQTNCRIEVRRAGATTMSMEVPVTTAMPGVFSPLLNKDYSVNSAANPAAPGSVVVLFGTGFGVTEPAGVDGKLNGAHPPAPRLPVSVQLAGREADVSYAAGAPFLVHGVFQVNARIPPGTAAGSVPLIVGAGPYRTGPSLRVHVE